MFDFKKIRDLKKSDKQEVDVTICYYPLEDNKDRYVFFFYDPTEKSPIYKWAYYLIDNNYKDLRKKFNEVIKEKNYKPNNKATLCMCNKTTKINTLKLPKTLKYSMNYKSIINEDLKDKMGSDVKAKYFISNKIEGSEEKNAEKVEKRAVSEAKKRIKKVNRYKEKVSQEEFEYKYEREHVEPLISFYNKLYLACSIIIVGLNLALLLLFLLGFVYMYLFISCMGLNVLYFTTLLIVEIIKTKKKIKQEKTEEKKRITYKNLMDGYYVIASAIFLYGSEVLSYFLYLGKLPGILWDIYGIFVFLYVLSIAICERLKRKKLSKLCVPIERKVKEKKLKVYHVEQDEEEEELFEGGMNENKLFNMSRSKVKITKSKKSKSVTVYRQLLVPKPAYKSAAKVAAVLHFSVKSLRTLPSLIASFHRKYSKGVNEIVAYNEAGFTLLVGFVNDQIIDCMFIEGNERAKNDEGMSIGLHLSTFRNVFSSMLWACQKETSNMDRVVYISNTPKNIDAFKKENLFGLPFEVVYTTDIVFGESVRKAKSLALLRAFTLVETVVAIAVFAITSSMVAGLALGINRFNRNQNDSSKANIYVNNICEVLNNDVKKETALKVFGNECDGTSTTGHYFIDSSFSVFKASNSEINNTYRVDYKMEISDVDGTNYKQYTFTFVKISRIGEQRKIVSNQKIEVISNEER